MVSYNTETDLAFVCETVGIGTKDVQRFHEPEAVVTHKTDLLVGIATGGL